jgi:hypothetical protein
MDKNDQPGTNKIRDKSVTGSNNPSTEGSKPGNKKKTERLKAAAVGKQEIDKPENEPKAERPKPKAISEINESDIENGEALNEVNPKSEINKLKAESQKPKAVPEVNKSDIENGEAINEVNPTSEIENPKSEIEKMEVHHHPQLDHNPKPIKEYLLEGFMIFIAVMMGFIAENIREGIDNSEHAKQLTTQLVQDLKADTVQLNSHIREETKIARHNDTLINLLQQPLTKVDMRQLQKLVADSHSMWLFHASAGAISAIKNELHLKQFSNSKIIGYFATYERHIELLHTDQDVNLQYQRLYLDPFLTQHFTPANMAAAFSDSPVPNAQMRDLTQRDMDQLATDMVLIRIITNEMIKDNRLVKTDATKLLQYVKKQYELDE